MGKGKKIIKQAEQMGFKKLPLTILYGLPRKVRMTFSKFIPDYVDIIRDSITSKDPDVLMKVAKGGRKRIDVFLSTKLNLYIETLGKISGFAGVDPGNHIFKISFWTDGDAGNEFIREFAKAMDQRFADVGGILEHINWVKIRKKYKVEKEDVLPAWNQILG
ncbi:MAG: hypothetical protein HWN65_16975 [Candidatus Helarchaeota archaeon]|nr:hypothetical protein [Candidatus Helarchaeota archaeon]